MRIKIDVNVAKETRLAAVANFVNITWSPTSELVSVSNVHLLATDSPWFCDGGQQMQDNIGRLSPFCIIR